MPAADVDALLADPESCYRVVSSRDGRWDGRLYLGVATTGVYCRPSCPARTPLQHNCRYYVSAAAAVAAGFRACRRCRPDVLPGTRDDDLRGDLAARALRLIRDGGVDEYGVAGLAGRLHVSERHLHRTLVAEVGVGPLRLAMSRRVQVARMLVEQSDVPMTDIAYAAGFASVRQFNDVVRLELGCPPSHLRRRRSLAGGHRDGDARRPRTDGPALTLRLRYREPYAVDEVWRYLGARLVPGVERADAGVISRPVRLDDGVAQIAVDRPAAGHVRLRVSLDRLDHLGLVVARVRRWLDLDGDPAAVDGVLGRDPAMAALVSARPGLRVPGTVDGFELAMRAVVGQQVSVAGAGTLLGRLAERIGTPGLLPSAAEVADAGAQTVQEAGLTGRRAATLVAVADAVASGGLALHAGVDRGETLDRLLGIAGIGPWTAQYVALRALGDPDAFPATDLVLARDIAARGLDPDRWRPWRGYAAMHLWTRPEETP